MEFAVEGLGFARGEAAIVTGGASGIGRATTELLVGAGVDVAAWDLNPDALASLVADMSGMPGRITPIAVDLTDTAAVDRSWQEMLALDLDVKYLVNNAGPVNSTPFSVREGASVALGMYAEMTDRYLADFGSVASSIVFTASVAGNFFVGATNDWYPAAKAGIAGYMRHLAVKLRGQPRSNGVAPSSIATPRTAASNATPESLERYKRQPMGRIGQPIEVATVICFLLSPAASFVNGVLVPVDGAATWTYT